MNPLQAYQGYQVQTASPGEQVAMLYEGARRFADLALRGLEEGRPEDVSLYTGKAQRILEELALCLNHDAGEIAGNLDRLYEYWRWRLGQGLIKQEPGAYREVSEALGQMAEAWREAARSLKVQRAAVHG